MDDSELFCSCLLMSLASCFDANAAFFALALATAAAIFAFLSSTLAGASMDDSELFCSCLLMSLASCFDANAAFFALALATAAATFAFGSLSLLWLVEADPLES